MEGPDKTKDIEQAEDLLEVPAKRKRGTEPDIEGSSMRVRLPIGLATQIRQALADLRERGGSACAEDLLADHFEKLSPTYFEDQLVRRTPEEYYLDIASKDPEIRIRLIKQAKRALSKKDVPPREKKEKMKSKVDGDAAVKISESSGRDDASD